MKTPLIKNTEPVALGNGESDGRAGAAIGSARHRKPVGWLLFALAVTACGLGYRYTGVLAGARLGAFDAHGINRAVYGRLNRDEVIYQTATGLAAEADTREERAYSAQTVHLADEMLDVSFAIALEEAAQAAAERPKVGATAQGAARVAAAKAAVAEDESQIAELKQAAGKPGGTQPQLDVADAQLGLDQARLVDATKDAEREESGGGERVAQLQQEHEALHGTVQGGGDTETLQATAAARNATTARGLVGDLRAAWLLNSKVNQVEAAEAVVRAAVPEILAEHDRLHAQFTAAEQQVSAGTLGGVARVVRLRELEQEQQQISRFDQQADSATELADTYGRWVPVAAEQRAVALHGALRSTLIILVMLGLLAAFLGVLERICAHSRWERKRAKTLRHMLGLAMEAVALLTGLMIFFGQPTQLLTMIGLAGAALTVAFQDAILSMAGWFVLMGRTGVHLGDWVEINGVVGEVIEIRLLKTVVLETGNWITAGHPTGRRVFFPNSFALKGSYFNYSTIGQWLWDELSVQLPADIDVHEAEKAVEQAVRGELGPHVERAQDEWQSLRLQAPFSTAPTVQLRPSGGGCTIVVRYTTAAQHRTQTRERLWQVIAATLEKLGSPAKVPGAERALTSKA